MKSNEPQSKQGPGPPLTILTKSFKSIIYAAIGASLVAYLLVGTLYRSQIVHRVVRDRVVQELRASLKKDVKIGRLSGNLITHIRLEDVLISDGPSFELGELMSVQEMDVYYDVFQGLSTGDFAAAIDRIDLNRPDVYLVRNRADQWNMLRLFPPPPRGVKLPPPTFKGQVFGYDMRIFYTDEKGWAGTPLKTPFTDTFFDLVGSMDFSDLDQTAFTLTGKMGETGQSIRLSGILNILNGQYSLSFGTPALDLTHWGQYVFPHKGFVFYKDFIRVEGRLVSKNPMPPLGQIPFDYGLSIWFSNSNFKLPVFPVPLTGLKAEASLNNAGIRLKSFSGLAAGIPFSGQGDIDFLTGSMALKIRASQFESRYLKQLLPVSKSWQYSGKANTTFTVKGPFNRLDTMGRFKVPKGAVYGFRPENLSGKFRLIDQSFSLQDLSAELYSGTVQGSGVFDLSHVDPFMVLSFSGSGLKMEQVFRAVPEHVEGELAFNGSVSGRTQDYAVLMATTESDFRLYNQAVTSVNLQARVTDYTDVDIPQFLVNLNESATPIEFVGRINDWDEFHARFTASKIKVHDVLSSPNPDQYGFALGVGSVQANLTPKFWQHPIDETTATINVSVQDYPLFGQQYESVNLDFLMNKLDMSVNRLELISASERLRLQGDFYRQIPLTLSLTTSGVNLTENPVFQSWISADLKPFGGYLTTDLTLSNRDKKPEKFNWSNMDLEMSGFLEEGRIQNQSYDRLEAHLIWNGRALTFWDGQFEYLDTRIAGNGRIDQNKDIDIVVLAGSEVDLTQVEDWLLPLGKFSGTVRGGAHIVGPLAAPVVDMDFEAINLQDRFLKIDRLQGDIRYEDGKVESQALRIEKGDAVYTLGGAFDFKQLSNPDVDLSALDYRVSIDVYQSDLKTLSDLIEGVYKEIKVKKVPNQPILEAEVASREAEDNQTDYEVVLSDPGVSRQAFPLYSRFQSSSLQYFQKILQQQQELENPSELGLRNLFQGLMSGYINLESRKGHQIPFVDAEVGLLDARLPFLKTGGLMFRANSSESHDIRFYVKATDGILGSQAFSKILVRSTLSQSGWLFLDQMDIATGEVVSNQFISGKIPLGAIWDPTLKDAEMALKCRFLGQDVGVLSVLSPYVTSIQNEGDVSFSVTGPLSRPLINAQDIILKNATVQLSDETMFRSPFKIESHRFSIIDNRAEWPPVQIIWKGEDTKNLDTGQIETNQFELSGDIHLSKLNLLDFSMVEFDLDLAISDTDLFVNFPQVYSGQVQLSNTHIRGPFPIPLTTESRAQFNAQLGTTDEVGALVSSEVVFSSGKIVLPSLSDIPYRPPFLLDVTGNIGSDVIVEGSVFGESWLADLANNIELSLIETEVPLRITGSLTVPKIENKLEFSEGIAYLLNQDFELLPEDRQRRFFSDQPDKIGPNELTFVTTTDPITGKRVLVPNLDLRALLVVEEIVSENVDAVSAVTDGYSYRGIVIHFDGSIYDVGSIQFDEYTLSGPYSANVQADYQKSYTLTYDPFSTESNQSEELLYLLSTLVPGFYQNTEQGQGVYLAALGEHQINRYFRSKLLRPLEKNVEKRVGLLDVRVDYNLGGAILQGAGVDQDLANRQDLNVDMVTNVLSPKLFLRVKTNLDLSSENRELARTFNLAEFELTYYLLKNLTVNYANIRDLDDTGELEPRFSVKYTHEF